MAYKTNPALRIVQTDSTAVFNALRRTFVEKLGLPPGAIILEADLVEDLEIESIDAIDVIAAVEALFGIQLQVREFMGIRRVSDLVELIVDACSRKQGAGPDSHP